MNMVSEVYLKTLEPVSRWLLQPFSSLSLEVLLTKAEEWEELKREIPGESKRFLPKIQFTTSLQGKTIYMLQSMGQTLFYNNLHK